MWPSECHAHTCIHLSASLCDLERMLERAQALTKLAEELNLPVDDQLTDHNMRTITVTVPSAQLIKFLEKLYRYNNFQGIHNVVIDCPNRYLVRMCENWGQIGEYVEP